jgi:uncharacterized membrane protein YgcG
MDSVKTAFRKHGFVEWVAYKGGEGGGFVLYDEKRKKKEEEGESEKKEGEGEEKKEEEKAEAEEKKKDEPADEKPAKEPEDLTVPLAERVLKRIAKESGEEGKMKMDEAMVDVRVANGLFPLLPGRVCRSTADDRALLALTEHEETAFYDDYENQIRRIFEKQAGGGSSGGRGGKGGRGGRGGGRGGKRKHDGEQGGGRQKRSRD